MQILAPRTGNCGHHQANRVAEPHGASKGAGPRRGQAGSELELSSPAARPIFHKSGYAKLAESKICLRNNAGDCWVQLPPIDLGTKGFAVRAPGAQIKAGEVFTLPQGQPRVYSEAARSGTASFAHSGNRIPAPGHAATAGEGPKLVALGKCTRVAERRGCSQHLCGCAGLKPGRGQLKSCKSQSQSPSPAAFCWGGAEEPRLARTKRCRLLAGTHAAGLGLCPAAGGAGHNPACKSKEPAPQQQNHCEKSRVCKKKPPKNTKKKRFLLGL